MDKPTFVDGKPKKFVLTKGPFKTSILVYHKEDDEFKREDDPMEVD